MSRRTLGNRHRRPSRKPHRRGFTGRRTDTEKLETTKTVSGSEYTVRRNGSKFPKMTTISLSGNTKKIYSFFREVGNYENFDELLLDIAKSILETGVPTSRLRSLPSDAGTMELIEPYLIRAKRDNRLREVARNRASRKHKYKHRDINW